MSPADRAAIATRLEAWRKIDPNMNNTVLFVATTHDATGVACTSLDGHAKPSKVAAARMTALAKSACRVIKEETVGLDPKRLFVPSLKDYDVLIHLNSKVLKSLLKTYATENPAAAVQVPKHSRFKNLDERTGQQPLPLAQHPADVLLKRLDDTYNGPLVFFRGAPEDSIIGAIWNPQMQRRSFRATLPTSYKPAAATAPNNSSFEDSEEEPDDVVDVNKEAIVAEIARIGGDLIEKVDVKGL